MTSLASVYVSDIDVGIILSHESVDFLLNCIVVVTSRLQLLLSGISISPLTCEDFLGHGSHAFLCGASTFGQAIDFRLHCCIVISCCLELLLAIIAVSPLACEDFFCDFRRALFWSRGSACEMIDLCLHCCVIVTCSS